MAEYDKKSYKELVARKRAERANRPPPAPDPEPDPEPDLPQEPQQPEIPQFVSSFPKDGGGAEPA